jgi:flagellar basal-body rod protein FlgB
MSINFDSALGIHDEALTLRAQRSEVLASNIANADTPNFKARDIDFRNALDQATAGQSRSDQLKTTHHNHISGTAPGGHPDTQYRIPLQPSLDGNTVDTQLEKTAYAENSVQYQTTLNILNRKFGGLLGAIRGE